MFKIEGSLEVTLPTIWTDEKQSREEAERRERLEERRVEEKEYKKKEDADAGKGRKVAKHCVFPMIWGSGGSKSRLAKAAGAEPAGQMRDEKLHAVVARSTFRSQNVQNTPAPDHFWKLRCRKSARRCGAKHICQVKLLQNTSAVRTTFGSSDLEKVHAVVARSTFGSQTVKNTRGSDHFWKFRFLEKVHAVVTRSTFGSQTVKNTRGSDNFWKFRSRKSARRCGAKHIWKSNC